MKSKMKSTFAIIAVALMVMVAVVPMVSVFTDNAQATTYYEPDFVAGTEITVEGRVYDVDGVGENDKIVQITWGNGSYSQVATTANDANNNPGWFSIVIKETSIKSATISVVNQVNGVYVVDSEYSQVLNKALESGTYNVDLMKAKKTSAVTVRFANGDNGYDLASVFGVEALGIKSLTFEYTIFATESSTSGTSGTYTVLPVASATNGVLYSVADDMPYIQVKSVKIDGTSYTVNSDKTVLGAASTEVVLKQFLLKVSTNATVPKATVTVQASNVSTAVKATKIFTDVLTNTSSAYFMYVPATAANEDPVAWASAYVTAKFSNDISDAAQFDIDGNSTITYGVTEGAHYYGVACMSTGGNQPTIVSAYDGQALNLSYKATATSTSYTTIKAVVQGGFFITASELPKDDNGKITAYSVKASIGNFFVSSFAGLNGFEDGEMIIPANTADDQDGGAIVSATGYSYITLAVEADREVNIDVSGTSDIFGFEYKNNKVTVPATSIAKGFFVKTGSVLSIIPADSKTVTYTKDYSAYIVGSAADAITFTTAAKSLDFVFVDGDGTPIAKNTFQIHYLLPGKTAATDVAVGTYEIDNIPGWYDLSAIKYWFADTDDTENTYIYTFDTDADNMKAYTPVDGVVYVMTLDETYSITLKDVNGNIIAGNITLSLDSAFVNESGYKVYTPVENQPYTQVTPASNGKYYFMYSSKYVGKEIGATAQTLLTVKVASDTYIFSSDRTVYTANLVITAGKVSFEGTLLKTNGSPFQGATVLFKENVAGPGDEPEWEYVDDSLYEIAVTDDKGKFKLISYTDIDDFAIGFDYYLDYDGTLFDEAYPIFDVYDEPIEYFFAAANVFMVTIADADGAIYDYSWIYEIQTAPYSKGLLTVNNEYVFNYLGYGFVILDSLAGDILPISMGAYQAGNVPTYNDMIRTFNGYTLTDSDITNGIISLTTQERTYSVDVYDANDKAINIAADGITVAVATGSIDTPLILDYVSNYINRVTGSMGSYTVVLPDLTDSTSKYGVYVDDENYVFDHITFFNNYAVDVESYYSKVYFQVADAAGNIIVLGYAPGTHTVDQGVYNYTNAVLTDSEGNDFTVTLDKAANKIWIIADEDETFKLKANANIYSTQPVNEAPTVIDTLLASSNKTIKDGIIKSSKQYVEFTFTDAVGAPLAGFNFNVTAFTTGDETSGTPIIVNKTTSIDGKISTTAAIKSTYTYIATQVVEENEEVIFNFEYTKGTTFVADKTAVRPTFTSANGVDLTDDIIAGKIIAGYAANGTRVSSQVVTENGKAPGVLYVDLYDVAYYAVDQSPVVGYTFAPSESFDFIAAESLITGSIPATAGVDYASQKMVLALYYGLDMVGSKVATIDPETQNTYTVVLPMNDFVDDVAGVAFDSIIGVYTEAGVTIATGTINPFTQVNDIYAPGQLVPVLYDVINKTEGVCAGHTVAYVINNVLILSADRVFYTADEGYYTDGQYKYTFAGWYVNGVKVSANPDYAENIDSNVVAAAQYDVTYEKISDVNAEKEKEIVEKEVPVGIDTNVLIIGICAVVIALIAVVYAVIKKE